jgi:PAS domain S-box-containing protein
VAAGAAAKASPEDEDFGPYQSPPGTISEDTIMDSVKMTAGFPFRLFSVLIIPLALLILGGAWYLAHNRIEGQLELIRANEVSRVVMGVRRLDGELETPLHHLRTLASSDTVRRAIGVADPEAITKMETAFMALIAYNETYDKMRWIDETGLERVRVNNVNGYPERVPGEQLRNRTGSYYFVNTMRLRPDQIFVSPLDLNVEHGRVEVPDKPVLRLAAPLQDSSGQPRGILIIDIAAQPLLDAFTESVIEARDHAMLLNPEGYWLRSPNREDAWGFMFQRNETLGTRHPEAWKSITSIPNGQVELADGLWTWSTVYPLKVGDRREIPNIPYWLVVSHLPASQLAPVHEAAWKTVSIPTLVLVAISGLLAAWLALALTGRKQAAVEAARAHAREEAAKRVSEARKRFETAVKANVNGVLAVDADGRILMANPALERMFGYDKGELIGRPVETLVPEAESHHHAGKREAYQRAPVARAMGIGRDLHGRRKDGSAFPVEISLSPFTENGKQYVDALVADISERKQTEVLLRKKEARLELLWQTNPNGLLVVDAEGRIQMANPALERMFGYAPGELLNRAVESLVPEPIIERHGEFRMQYLRNPSTRAMGAGLDLRGRRRDGSTFPIEVSLATFTEDSQVFVQATIVDMTGWRIGKSLASQPQPVA